MKTDPDGKMETDNVDASAEDGEVNDPSDKLEAKRREALKLVLLVVVKIKTSF